MTVPGATDDLLALRDETARVTLAFVATALVALAVGTFFGPLQALNYGGYDAYRPLLPAVSNYYQGLTLHGVMNAYAFTTFFMSGLMYYLVAHETGARTSAGFAWLWYALMLAGLVMAFIPMATNEASVLYTFYSPMMASASFYAGIGLIFAASWGIAGQILLMRHRWRKQNPGRATPLVTWMSAVTMLMWMLASLGAVSAIVFYQLPAALGAASGTPPVITRTLFWWTGHPIVYFWLMPAYISWYALLPRQIGGVLISDPMARVSFILLMIFSLPVGTHHQLMDAGIPDVMRAVVVFLTFVVILPSLMTAFTVGASLEYAGRRSGGKGLLGWVVALPWRDPSVAAQLLAMLLFIVGGASGLVNGSWALNAVIHNTTWVAGHLHVTLASASVLSFFGISFWLLPRLTGKPLFSPKAALTGVWLWFAGMLLFSNAMMIAGLLGVPRRAWISGMTEGGGYDVFYQSAAWPLFAVGVAGVILGAAAILIVGVLFATLLRPRFSATSVAAIPFASSLRAQGSERIVRAFDKLSLWTLICALAIVSVYGPVLWSQWVMSQPLPGMRVW